MVKYFSLLLSLFLLVFFSLAATAKKVLPVETESPASETEIICFAAMEKWVCAPASDQQQAKAKAMRLIEEKAEQVAVVIKTLPVEKQWQEAVVDESTEAGLLTEPEKPIEVLEPTAVVEPAETVQITAVQNEPSQSQTQSQNFSDWKDNHAMKWTLQAVGTTNLPNLENFINQNNLNNETMSVATTEVKGAPWHIVLVGMFADRDQALAYKSQLESKGEDWASHAWPRPIAGIVTID